jgi:hypothetical protein
VEVKFTLGSGYRLSRVARWDEGVALPADDRTRLPESVARKPHRWAGREPGSAARECLDELLAGRRFSGRQVAGHAAVAEAVHAGWAGAGVCVRLSAEDAGLNFLPVRTEALDFCFVSALQHDPRLHALIRHMHSRAYRRLASELPGYDARQTCGASGTIFICRCFRCRTMRKRSPRCARKCGCWNAGASWGGANRMNSAPAKRRDCGLRSTRMADNADSGGIHS